MTDVDELLRDLADSARNETSPPTVDVQQRVRRTIAGRVRLGQLDWARIAFAGVAIAVAASYVGPLGLRHALNASRLITLINHRSKQARRESNRNRTPTRERPRCGKSSIIALLAQLIVLLLVFAAGGVLGATVATRTIFSRMQAYRANSPVFAEDTVSRLQTRLGLDDSQSKLVREIVARRHSRLIEFRRHGAQTMNKEFDALEREVAEVLDERQVLQWRGTARGVRDRFLPLQSGHESN